MHISCGKKERPKNEEDAKPKFIPIDFDKIKNEKLIKENNNGIKKVPTIDRKKINVTDTIIWEVYVGQVFKRMFYGKVKSSEEFMYKMRRDASGSYKKSSEVYYKNGVVLPWNLRVEFDSLKRVQRVLHYTYKANDNYPAKMGQERFYNDKGRLVQQNTLKPGRFGLSIVASVFYYYNENGKKKYRITTNRDIVNGNKMFVLDSFVYIYNKQNKLLKTKDYYRDLPEEKLTLFDTVDRTISYKYHKKNRIIEKNKKNGSQEKFTYKDGKLVKKTGTLYGATSVYEYYPTGIIKFARLRTTMVQGDFNFNEFGQVTHKNGRQVAKFFDYDKYGNWTKRISYTDNGTPETYTDRVIEYYE